MASTISPFAAALQRPGGESQNAEIVELRDRVNARMATLLPAQDKQPVSLHGAMRFSLLGPGKRVRPIMSALICDGAKNGLNDFALDAGCAVEMVHTASLILDDLPCMDDAQKRRGRATTHIEYSQSTAILAAIGLMNRAYEVIAENEQASDELKTRAQKILAQAIGSNGLIAGQEIDLNERKRFDEKSRIEGLNWLKTGVLFVASAELGAVAAGLNEDNISSVCEFAKHVGLAFQTADDLIDVTVDAAAAGKDVDQDTDKPTLVTIEGVKAARNSCEEHLALAVEALNHTGLETSKLENLIENIFGRASAG